MSKYFQLSLLSMAVSASVLSGTGIDEVEVSNFINRALMNNLKDDTLDKVRSSLQAFLPNHHPADDQVNRSNEQETSELNHKAVDETERESNDDQIDLTLDLSEQSSNNQDEEQLSEDDEDDNTDEDAGFGLAGLLKARYLQSVDAEIEREGHTMYCTFQSGFSLNEEGGMLTQGTFHESLQLGQFDSNNFLLWNNPNVPNSFSCEGTGMELGGHPLKYIMTQVNPDNEMRSWLISEEARVDMMLGLDVEIGTKFKISFLEDETYGIVYGGPNCDEHDDRQQVFVNNFKGWNGQPPVGKRERATLTPGSFKIVHNENNVDLILAQSSDLYDSQRISEAEGVCIENTEGKVYAQFDN